MLGWHAGAVGGRRLGFGWFRTEPPLDATPAMLLIDGDDPLLCVAPEVSDGTE